MGIRAFIAIEISEPLRQELHALQQELKKSEADVKWVKPENMHLTLKFLGETEEGKIEKIKESLNKVAQEMQPFELSLSGIGVFPKLDFPRVVWAGIERGKENLIQLATIIEENLSELGFPKEKRPFSTHLTLGRVRSPKNKDRLKRIIEEKVNFRTETSISVDKIILFRSQLTPQGPIYSALAKFNLC